MAVDTVEFNLSMPDHDTGMYLTARTYSLTVKDADGATETLLTNLSIGQLVMYINVYLVNRLMDAFGQAYQLGQQWVIVAMSIVAIMNVAAVPKIAAYIIESTGANDAHSSSIGGIRETVQTAGALKAILRK